MHIGPCVIVIVEEKETNLMSLFIKFYFTSSMLNMFRTLIHPSSGACDFSIVSPHWSRVLVSMCVGVSVWLGWSGICVTAWSLPRIIRNLRLFYCITTLVVCSCFDACWSFGVAGLEWHLCCGLKASVHHTDTTPTQPHRNSNTYRNKNTPPMWWYNRKVAGSWRWMY